MMDLSFLRYIDMAESLCQKRALEAFRLDPEKWGGANLSFEILGKILVVFLMLQ